MIIILYKTSSLIMTYVNVTVRKRNKYRECQFTIFMMGLKHIHVHVYILADLQKVAYIIVWVFFSDQNQQCLAQLIETEGKIKEEKIKCLLAMHYFKPLALHGKYVVDNCHGYEKCEMCNEPVKADQTLTSFGKCRKQVYMYMCVYYMYIIWTLIYLIQNVKHVKGSYIC